LENYYNLITDQSKNLIDETANYLVESTVPDHLAEKATAASTTASFVKG
jgi:hypothetical protein